MEVLSKTTLLQWMILHSLSREELDSETITSRIAEEFSLYTGTATLRTKVNNLLISLVAKHFASKFVYGRLQLYKITSKGKQALTLPIAKWKEAIHTQLTCLEKMLEACYKQKTLHGFLQPPYDQTKLLTQSMHPKSVFSYLSLVELDQLSQESDSAKHYISIVQLQRVIQKRYGWSCSSTTFITYITRLVEKGYLHLSFGSEQNGNKVRMVSIREDGRRAIEIYSVKAHGQIIETKCMLKEIQNIFA
ncbi:hypothetical protein N0O92_19225 [Alkalihalobacillus sp. MEB130]|uniref:hypothetical protein n=1 Tax=Alkalihalobacillus sp. MEB130 TaxID=2976704 RepID=UPI0028DDBA9D|nr:hypothetical protein [Alkalihalobacillus sp. MEB130]MDT8862347.1 hypothetical protein [Alkalihalobacillus sp. MEB130]